MEAELARVAERFMFRRAVTDDSPLLDDNTREIIADAIAHTVVRALELQAEGDGFAASAWAPRQAQLEDAGGRELVPSASR
jgi:hypothetical protein